MEPITYELKYCERCGSLGLRRLRSSETYCESCAQILTTTFRTPGAAAWPRRSASRVLVLPSPKPGEAPTSGRLP